MQKNPASQSVQTLAPASEYMPSTQGVQPTDFAVELDPAGQMVTLVDVQLDPEGQSVQAAEAAYEYVPLAQAVLMPSLHADPASQEVQLVEPAEE